MTKQRTFLAIAIAFAFGGCVGSVDDMPGATGATEGGSGSPGGVNQQVPQLAACSGTPNPGRVTVHRLNRLEYNNTIRDLLGNTSRPADELPPDVPVGGFDNNSFGLNVDSSLLQRYDDAGRRLAQGAVLSPGFIDDRCKPAGPGDTACARKILEPFTRRAWRRPVTDAEIDGLVKLVELAAGEGDTFGNGLALAVEAVLVSPSFLYRFEYRRDPQSSGPYSLDAHALASRLSYFLWSSMPDEALFAAADSGALVKPDELARQVSRMLVDAKAGVLTDNLAQQWLQGQLIEKATPNPAKFPAFDALRASIPAETSLFLGAFVRENRDLRGLLDADFTFVNEGLARHYGITSPKVSGAEFQRVPLTTNPRRGGLLSQGTYLVATSHVDQPSIPLRGKWVLQNLLCRPPAAPPPDANNTQAEIEKALGQNPSRRKIAEARDKRPECAGCHLRFDPIGFAFDKYDAAGAWREKDGTQAIDTSGTLDGQAFDGPKQISSLLRNDPGLPGCVATALFRYALGRILASTDQCILEDITTRALARGFGAQEVIAAVVSSPAFRFQGE